MINLIVIAGEYPAASETFVWREVQGLRQLGWEVTTVGLRPAQAPALGVRTADLFVYGPQQGATFRSSVMELVSHPMRSLVTVFTAVKDAVSPGERMVARDRIKLMFQAIAGIGLARRLRAGRPSHLHCQFAHAPTSVGMYAAMQLGLPFTFTGHANDLFQRRSLLKRKLQRASGVACISEWHAKWYQSIEPSCQPRCHVVRCGVDLPTDQTQPILEGNTIHLISVGRLVEKKGFDTLIHAFGQLHTERPGQWRLTIVGGGPLDDELRQLAVRLGCLDAVTFTGALPHAAALAKIDEADVFVMPCRNDASGDRDGIPVAMMEAMARGRLVVAGDLPAIRELVSDGQTGWLVNHDPNQVAERLRAIADNVPTAKGVAAVARDHVAREFSTRINLERLAALIESASARAESTVDCPHLPKATAS